MNLNYGYNEKALLALIETADANRYEHKLVIDFDGEVILNPEVKYPHVPLDSYKYSITIMDSSLRQRDSIAPLYDALERIYTKFTRADREIGYDRMSMAA